MLFFYEFANNLRWNPFLLLNGIGYLIRQFRDCMSKNQKDLGHMADYLDDYIVLMLALSTRQ